MAKVNNPQQTVLRVRNNYQRRELEDRLAQRLSAMDVADELDLIQGALSKLGLD
jgi:hypothetical protein